MKVRELVEKLRGYDLDAEVTIVTEDGGRHSPVSFHITHGEAVEVVGNANLSACCNARMVHGGSQCEACGSNGK